MPDGSKAVRVLLYSCDIAEDGLAAASAAGGGGHYRPQLWEEIKRFCEGNAEKHGTLFERSLIWFSPLSCCRAESHDPATIIKYQAQEQAVFALICFNKAIGEALEEVKKFFEDEAPEDDAAPPRKRAAGGVHGVIAEVAAEVAAEQTAALDQLAQLDTALVRAVCAKLVGTIVISRQMAVLRATIHEGLITAKDGAKFEAQIAADMRRLERSKHDEVVVA